MPAAFYDFFRKIKFLPNNVTIEADSTTDTAQILHLMSKTAQPAQAQVQIKLLLMVLGMILMCQ